VQFTGKHSSSQSRKFYYSLAHHWEVLKIVVIYTSDSSATQMDAVD